MSELRNHHNGSYGKTRNKKDISFSNNGGETKSHELRITKRSLSQKFAVAMFAMFADGKIDNIYQNHKNPESEDTKIRVVLEVQHLDRERKKSLLMLDFDGILLILQHEEHKQPTGFAVMENQVTMDGKADDHATDEELWNARQKEIKKTTEEGLWKKTKV